MRHHLLDLDAFVPAALKILPHPVFQTDGLSNINDMILLIMHDVNAGSAGQFFQFFLNIEIIILHLS